MVFVVLAVVSAMVPITTGPATATAVPVRPEEGEVTRLYRSVLDRTPDRAGFAYWVTLRVEGVSLRAVADGFLNSPEFATRFGNGSDVDFLDMTYHNVLGRPGDQAGTLYWLDQLANGLPRTELVLLFSESIEHRLRTGTADAALPEFEPVISPVSTADLGSSWRTGCPVSPIDLRAVVVDHVDFTGAHRRGTLIVNAEVVDEVSTVFEHLYRARYPIQSVEPVDVFGSDDDASMAANNTSAFNCRAITGGSSWSRHAYGTAIDINPEQNPYVSGHTVLPPAGAAHIDRSVYHPAMIRPGDVVTTAFAQAGWRWGGDFRTLKDYQHFQR